MNVKENGDMDFASMERKFPKKSGRDTKSIFTNKVVLKTGRGGDFFDEDDLDSLFSEENYNMLKAQFKDAPKAAKDYFISELDKIETGLGAAFKGDDHFEFLTQVHRANDGSNVLDLFIKSGVEVYI